MINWVMAIKQGQGKRREGGMLSQRWIVSAPFDTLIRSKSNPFWGRKTCFALAAKPKTKFLHVHFHHPILDLFLFLDITLNTLKPYPKRKENKLGMPPMIPHGSC